MDVEAKKMNYLNDPSIVGKFKRNYLSYLNLYLNNESFKKKMDQLPNLKSATIVKLEKQIGKQNEINKTASRNKLKTSINRSSENIKVYDSGSYERNTSYNKGFKKSEEKFHRKFHFKFY